MPAAGILIIQDVPRLIEAIARQQASRLVSSCTCFNTCQALQRAFRLARSTAFLISVWGKKPALSLRVHALPDTVGDLAAGGPRGGLHAAPKEQAFDDSNCCGNTIRIERMSIKAAAVLTPTQRSYHPARELMTSSSMQWVWRIQCLVQC
jgi:hypothetical protein